MPSTFWLDTVGRLARYSALFACEPSARWIWKPGARNLARPAWSLFCTRVRYLLISPAAVASGLRILAGGAAHAAGTARASSAADRATRRGRERIENDLRVVGNADNGTYPFRRNYVWQ